MKKTVMLVDDSLFMRNVLRGIVQSQGFTVVAEAGSGIEAMKKLSQHRPGIILLDIILPDANGLDLLQSLVAASPHVAVVICSSLGQESVIKKALDGGAKAFIQKPFTPEKIAEALDRLEA